MKLRFFFLSLLFAFSSCVTNYPIAYKYKDIVPTSKTTLSKYVFDIETFVDAREESKETEEFFTEDRMERIDGVLNCLNSEKHYRKKPVTTQVTEVLAKHLIKKKIFKGVLLNQKDSADFYVTGKLVNFYAKQRVSKKAITGSQFGLIGALATNDTKSNSIIAIEIQELKLFNKRNELIKDYGSFKRKYEGDFKADAYCWCAYENLNIKLKDFYIDLVYALEKDLSSAITAQNN